MSEPLVRSESDAGVTVLTLDDPAHRNALSHALSAALARAVAGALEDGARAIVLAAAPPVFCAGGSIDDLLEPPGPLSDSYAGLNALLDCPLPTVAAVSGAAIGAGVSLPLACDVVVVGEEAHFDPRFLDVAIHPGGGHLWMMARRVGFQGAAAMTICGDVLSGAEAVTAGMAWRCVPTAEVLEVALGLARRAAGRPAALVQRTKASLVRSAAMARHADAAQVELEAQEWSVRQPEHAQAIERLRARIRGSN